jgi:hypothetical protein
MDRERHLGHDEKPEERIADGKKKRPREPPGGSSKNPMS